MSLASIERSARPFAFAVLAAVTVYGVYQFARGDMASALDYWRGKLWLLPLVTLLAAFDIVFEGGAWMWVSARFGVRAADLGGLTACVASRAGLLLPAQLGRLIRPDAMARMGRAPLDRCLKVEAVTFALDVLSVVALLVGIAAGRVHPLVGVAAGAGVVAVALGLGHGLADLVSGTRLELPRGFWWSWRTVGAVVLEMGGWVVHGLALWLLIRGLSDSVTPGAAVFFSAASSVLGVGTGLPGGVGAIEGLLGAALAWMKVPPEHLAFAVGGFRAASFWVWVPIGWLALLRLRRFSHPPARAGDSKELTPSAEGP